jgi:hypothetical protein
MREAAAYIRSRLPDLAAVDDDTVAARIRYGLRRARSAGFGDAAAIRLYVLLMFALEPEFDERTRVREHFAQRTGSLDDRLLRMSEWSYPNCWYRADPAFAEERWRALMSFSEPDDAIPWPEEGEPAPPQLQPGYGFQLDVPIIPTPDAVLTKMLELAELGPSDFLIDLGCGDGRTVIAAARRFGARGLGIDLDPEQLGKAREAAQTAGVANLVSFRRQDLLDADVSGATGVTLYLLRDLNLRLREKLRSQLRPGARVISRTFDMGDWPPDVTIEMPGERIFRWTIP